MRTNFFRIGMTVLLAVCVSNTLIADEKTDDKSRDKSDSKPITAIVGGDIHTVTGPMIRQGTILIQEGKILEVGQSVTVPEGATVIDASGKTVTPGFVAISMRSVGVSSTPSTSNKLADSLNPFDRNLKFSLGVGITSGCVELSSSRGRSRRRRDGEPEELFPGLEKPLEEYETTEMLDYGDLNTSLCPCCGLPVLPTEPITAAPPTAERPRKMAALKMSYGNLDAMLMKENVFYSPSPGALNGALQRHNWRIEVKKAREAMAAKEKADKEKLNAASKSKTTTSKTTTAKKTEKAEDSKKTTTKTSSSRKAKPKPVKPELASLLKRETAMRIPVNTVDEIRDMVELGQELGYDVVVEGGIEAWALGKELGAAEVGVIYTPRRRRSPQKDQEETTGSFVESPRIFQESGVPFAVATLSNSISMSGLAGRDLTSLPLEAAFAVRGGASERLALAAITITPAKMMGLDDRIGSIEKGKDADILILNGSPLDYRTYVEHAIVAGKIAYQRDKDRVYPVYDRKN